MQRGSVDWMGKCAVSLTDTQRASSGKNRAAAAIADLDTSKPTDIHTLTATDEDLANGPAYPSSSSTHGTIATTRDRATGTRTASPPAATGDTNTTSQRGGVTTGETTDRTASRDGGNPTTNDDYRRDHQPSIYRYCHHRDWYVR